MEMRWNVPEVSVVSDSPFLASETKTFAKKFLHTVEKQQKNKEMTNAKIKICYGLFEGNILRVCESRELLCFS
jgi:hypothetical protein